MVSETTKNGPRNRQRASQRGPARAFTLIELVVVIGIIILLVAIAVPAVGPAVISSQETQMRQLLTNAVTMAQTRAQNGSGYAIRIERAFKTDDRGFMVDANGQSSDSYYTGLPGYNRSRAPVYLPYQQIRFLQPCPDIRAYKPTVHEPIKLPDDVWLGPDYALSGGFDPKCYAPTYELPTGPRSVPIKPFETFCIAFNQQGKVVQLRQNVPSDRYQYYDQTQPDNTSMYPLTAYPYPSARGVIMYDREQLESYGSDTKSIAKFLAREGRFLYINRYLGTLVEGRTR